jgi:hypothetical protein
VATLFRYPAIRAGSFSSSRGNGFPARILIIKSKNVVVSRRESFRDRSLRPSVTSPARVITSPRRGNAAAYESTYESTLTFVVINVVVALHLELYAAISAGPARRALATVLAVLQRAQSVPAARVLASGCARETKLPPYRLETRDSLARYWIRLRVRAEHRRISRRAEMLDADLLLARQISRLADLASHCFTYVTCNAFRSIPDCTRRSHFCTGRARRNASRTASDRTSCRSSRRGICERKRDTCARHFSPTVDRGERAGGKEGGGGGGEGYDPCRV